jgi:hypothetical protein
MIPPPTRPIKTHLQEKIQDDPERFKMIPPLFIAYRVMCVIIDVHLLPSMHSLKRNTLAPTYSTCGTMMLAAMESNNEKKRGVLKEGMGKSGGKVVRGGKGCVGGGRGCEREVCGTLDMQTSVPFSIYTAPKAQNQKTCDLPSDDLLTYGVWVGMGADHLISIKQELWHLYCRLLCLLASYIWSFLGISTAVSIQSRHGLGSNCMLVQLLIANCLL